MAQTIYILPEFKVVDIIFYIIYHLLGNLLFTSYYSQSVLAFLYIYYFVNYTEYYNF